MVPFESLCTVSYLHFIASIAVSLGISEIYSASKNGVTMKSGFKVVQDH